MSIYHPTSTVSYVKVAVEFVCLRLCRCELDISSGQSVSLTDPRSISILHWKSSFVIRFSGFFNRFSGPVDDKFIFVLFFKRKFPQLYDASPCFSTEFLG